MASSTKTLKNSIPKKYIISVTLFLIAIIGVSPEKSKLMRVRFNHRSSLSVVSIGEQAVKAVREMKVLG